MLLLIITVAGMLCGAIVDGDGWSPVQGANYVPSYSKHDVHITHPTIFIIIFYLLSSLPFTFPNISLLLLSDLPISLVHRCLTSFQRRIGMQPR